MRQISICCELLFQLFPPSLFLLADLNQAVTLTEVPNLQIKICKLLSFLHLDLCQMHCNYEEMFDSGLDEKSIVTYFCHLP